MPLQVSNGKQTGFIGANKVYIGRKMPIKTYPNLPLQTPTQSAKY